MGLTFDFLLGSFGLTELLTIIFYAYIYSHYDNYTKDLTYGSFFLHPLLMLTAFGVISPLGAMSYAILERRLGVSHNYAKLSHAVCNGTAWIIGVLGTWDMYVAHEWPHAGPAAKQGHWLSIHSWLGLWIMISWTLQLFSGAYLFYISSNASLKRTLIHYHRVIGRFLTLSTIYICILGILSFTGRTAGEANNMWKTLGVILFAHAIALMISLNEKLPPVGKEYTNLQ